MKAVYASLSEIPEAFRSEYEERGGQFHLKLEGDFAPLVEANTKLAEFRDNNRALNAKKTELENLLKNFEGLDPKEYKELKAKITEFEKSGARKPDDVSKMIADAVRSAVEPLQSELTSIKTQEAQAKKALQMKGLEDSLRDVGTKLGVRDTAIRDFVRRGTEVFQVTENGKYAALDGDTPLFSKARPAEPLSMEEWAAALQKEASHLFEPSKGGGTPPGGPGGNGGVFAPTKSINADPLEFGRNLEGIAKGSVAVNW
jgi:hypothetical protein